MSHAYILFSCRFIEHDCEVKKKKTSVSNISQSIGGVLGIQHYFGTHRHGKNNLLYNQYSVNVPFKI